VIHALYLAWLIGVVPTFVCAMVIFGYEIRPGEEDQHVPFIIALFAAGAWPLAVAVVAIGLLPLYMGRRLRRRHDRRKVSE
jgi:hypothetical protein